MSPDLLDLLRALLGADVDVLTSVSGIGFEDAWPRKVQANFAEGVRCNVIGLEALLQNKRAAGRPQDLADVAALERLHRLKK